MEETDKPRFGGLAPQFGGHPCLVVRGPLERLAMVGVGVGLHEYEADKI